MKKKILYIDMDGVIADFDKYILSFCPEINDSTKYPNSILRDNKIDSICSEEEAFFQDIPLVNGAIEAIQDLFNYYDVYFLSSPIWDLPNSFIGKRIWIEKHFGDLAKKRLILTHRKDLNIGDFLVDDRVKNGVDHFKGMHIHFGTEKFSNWEKNTIF